MRPAFLTYYSEIIELHSFLIIKPTRCTNFLNLFLEWNSTCFRQFLCPSSGVAVPLLCVQWKTSHDGQRNCPKHVEFYSTNKFEKLVYLRSSWFYYKKFITMHSHMNVKLHSCYDNLKVCSCWPNRRLGQWWSKVIAPCILNLSIRWRSAVSFMTQPLYL